MSDKAREERRKAALRENLKKRKAQARQRSTSETDAPLPDSGGAATSDDKRDA
jgi:hypothetical protein